MNARPSKTRPLRLAAAFAACVLAVLALVDLRAERRFAPPRITERAAAAGALRAGAGRAPFELPADVALAGYRLFGRSPRDGATPLHARSLLVEAGGVRTALVLVELMTLPPELAEAIRRRAAAAGAACTLVVASHTHSGPGGYDRSFLPQLALGRYRQEVEGAILAAVESSLAAARADLGPALLALGEGEAAGLASNRDHKGAAVDARLTLAALGRPDGRRIATLARFSAHPTLNPKAVGPAGDWPGFVMERLDEGGGVSFILPGAVGDARPTRAASPGVGRVRALTFAESVLEALGGIELEPAQAEVPLGCASVAFDLPAADLRGMVPPGLGRLVSNLADPAAPREAAAIAWRLGELALIGVPAEPLAAGAPVLEQVAEEAGLRGRVVGLAQGYVSYLVGEAEMEKRAPSARNAWFGEALAPRVEEAARAATRALELRPAIGERIAD